MANLFWIRRTSLLISQQLTTAKGGRGGHVSIADCKSINRMWIFFLQIYTAFKL